MGAGLGRRAARTGFGPDSSANHNRLAVCLASRERNRRAPPLSNHRFVNCVGSASNARQHDRHFQETPMPYSTVADLPKAQTDQYNPHQKKAFLEAFNNAYKEYKGDESRAFAVAHSAAKKAGSKPGPG